MSIPQPSPAFGVVALGEVMLRLDPGAMRIHTTRSFDVWEGGGEYNVARALRRAFGTPASIVTALVDNPIGRLVEDLMLQAGVNIEHVTWRAHDGVGRECRNGLNFTDRGFGPRAGVGIYDRGHTAASQMAPGQVNWAQVFDSGKVQNRVFHTGGIFAALGARTPDLVLEGFQEAGRRNILRCFDLNFRDSLWRAADGSTDTARVRALFHELVSQCDVLFGNADQFAVCLGYTPEARTGSTPAETARHALAWLQQRYPKLRGAFCTTRFASDASHHRWGALGCWDGQIFEVPESSVAVYDRVGGGDAAAAGFIYGIVAGRGLEWACRCAVTHGALAMSTPGDASMVTLPEIEQAMSSDQVRMLR